MPAINPMKKLYKRLSQVGLTRTFVRATALPSWWEDELALTPAGEVATRAEQTRAKWTMSRSPDVAPRDQTPGPAL